MLLCQAIQLHFYILPFIKFSKHAIHLIYYRYLRSLIDALPLAVHWICLSTLCHATKNFSLILSLLPPSSKWVKIHQLFVNIKNLLGLPPEKPPPSFVDLFKTMLKLYENEWTLPSRYWQDHPIYGHDSELFELMFDSKPLCGHKDHREGIANTIYASHIPRLSAFSKPCWNFAKMNELSPLDPDKIIHIYDYEFLLFELMFDSKPLYEHKDHKEGIANAIYARIIEVHICSDDYLLLRWECL